MENAEIQPALDGPEKEGGQRAEIRCGKCGHRNRGGERRCARCRSSLHIACKRCGHRNLRAANHCSHCQQRLHQSIFRRLKHKFGRNRRLKFTLLQILLVIGMAFVAYRIIVRLSNYEPPASE